VTEEKFNNTMSVLNDFDCQRAEIDRHFKLVSGKLEIATPYAGTDAGEANREGARILLAETEILIKTSAIYECKLLKSPKKC
jgi:hypothetical protein